MSHWKTMPDDIREIEERARTESEASQFSAMVEHARLQEAHQEARCAKCCGEQDHAGCNKCKDEVSS